jgi:hypothetical protein
MAIKNGVFWDVTPCGSSNIPEDAIHHSYCRKNLRSYIELRPFWEAYRGFSCTEIGHI